MSLTVGKKHPAQTCFVVEVLEEFLVVDASHSADLGHLHLSPAVVINKVGGDANGQFPTGLLPLKAWR